MMSVDSTVASFATFLRQSWTAIDALKQAVPASEGDAIVADWLQANWELLVEAALRFATRDSGLFLERYAEGADCNDRSSRVWMPGALPTHRVLCQPRGGLELRDLLTGSVLSSKRLIAFDRYVSRTPAGWYAQSPPFDHVLASVGEREVLLKAPSVQFVLEALG